MWLAALHYYWVWCALYRVSQQGIFFTHAHVWKRLVFKSGRCCLSWITSHKPTWLVTTVSHHRSEYCGRCQQPVTKASVYQRILNCSVCTVITTVHFTAVANFTRFLSLFEEEQILCSKWGTHSMQQMRIWMVSPFSDGHFPVVWLLMLFPFPYTISASTEIYFMANQLKEGADTQVEILCFKGSAT